jgi:hypothetical protein
VAWAVILNVIGMRGAARAALNSTGSCTDHAALERASRPRWSFASFVLHDDYLTGLAGFAYPLQATRCALRAQTN